MYDESKAADGDGSYNVTVDISSLNASQLVTMKIFNNGTHNLTTVHKTELPLSEKGRFRSLGGSACVVFLGNKLHSHIASFYSGV